MIIHADRSETKVDTSVSKAHNWVTVSHTSSLSIKCYWSFKYCLKGERLMHMRRSSRLPQTSRNSLQRSPIQEDAAVHHQLKGKKLKAGLRKTKADHRVHGAGAGKECDIIGVIDTAHDAVAKEEDDDDDDVVEVTDNGLDDSSDDNLSVASSVASGPSQLHSRFFEELNPDRSVCSACQKLCQKAKRTKTPLTDKLLDNDPKSLTCDHWVLMKKWRPLRNVGGEDSLSRQRMNILNQLLLVQKRLRAKKSKAKQHVGEGEKSICSRPHVFLQRNLRCVRFLMKKERKSKKRKRKSSDSRGPRVAKLRRLHGNSSHQHNTSGHVDNTSLHPTTDHTSIPGPESSRCMDDDSPEQTAEVFPSSVNLETSKIKKDSSEHRAPKKAGRFRELLAQLRGNNSMIVREKQ